MDAAQVLTTYDDFLRAVSSRLQEADELKKDYESLAKEVKLHLLDAKEAKKTITKLVEDLKAKDKEIACFHDREATYILELRGEVLASSKLLKIKNELEVVLSGKRRLEREVDCANGEIERLKRQNNSLILELGATKTRAGEEIQAWQRRCFDAERRVGVSQLQPQQYQRNR